MHRRTLTETLGAGSGAGTVVTSSGTANSKGAWVSLGTPSFDYSAIDIDVIQAGSTVRHLFDIGIGASGAQQLVVSNLFCFIGAAGPFRARLPVFLPAGVEVWARSQTSTGNQATPILLRGRSVPADSRRSFAAFEGIAVDTGNTRPTAVGIGLGNSWVELVASLSRDYGAFLIGAHDNAVNLVTAQTGTIALGAGASGSEVELARLLARFNSGSTAIQMVPTLVETPLAAGQRVVGRAQAPTTGDNIRIYLGGLY